MASRNTLLKRRNAGKTDSSLKYQLEKSRATFHQSNVVFDNLGCIEDSDINPFQECVSRNIIHHRSEVEVYLSSTEMQVSSLRLLESPNLSSLLRKERLKSKLTGRGDTKESNRATVSDIRFLLKRLNRMEADNTQLRNTVTLLKKQRVGMEQIHLRERMELEQAKSEERMLSKELENVNNSNEKLLKELEKTMQLLKSMEKESVQYKRTIEYLKEQLQSEELHYSIQASNTMEELGDLKAEIKMMRYEKQNMFNVGEAQRQELEKCKLQLERIQKEKKQLTTQVDELQVKNTTLGSDGQKLSDSLKQTEKEKTLLESKIEEIKQIDQLKIAEINKLNKDIAQLQKEMVFLQYDLDRKNREIERMKSTIESLKFENLCKDKDCSEAKETIRKLQSSLKLYQEYQMNERNQVTELTGALQIKDNEIASLQEQLDIYMKQLEELKQELQLPLAQQNLPSGLRHTEDFQLKMNMVQLQSMQVNGFDFLKTSISTVTADCQKEIRSTSSDPSDMSHDTKCEQYWDGSKTEDAAPLSTSNYSKPTASQSTLDIAIQTELSAKEVDEVFTKLWVKQKDADENMKADNPIVLPKQMSSAEKRQGCLCRKDKDSRMYQHLLRVNKMLWTEVKNNAKNLKSMMKKYKNAKKSTSNQKAKRKKVQKDFDRLMKDHWQLIATHNILMDQHKANLDDKVDLKAS